MRNWESLSRAELDDGYANADYITDAATYLTRWPEAAARFRAAHPPRVLSYGPGASEKIDLFEPDGATKGLMIFVHGGCWRRFGRRDWSHFAEGGLAHGMAVALVGYPLAPSVRISTITTCVTRAVDAAAAEVTGSIRLVGHSAGGHLVARMVMPDAAPDCAGRIATCVPISPVVDLRPLVPQSLNADLRLDEREAVAESPALGAPIPGLRCAVHVGADERPSFLWQAEALAQAWTAPLTVAAGRHHFDVIDDLRDPASALMADVMA